RVRQTPGESYYLDAGPDLKLSGPSGEFVVPQDFDDHNSDFGSVYSLSFDSGKLAPGVYSITNSAGGKDVDSFRISFPVGPPPVRWNNQDALKTLAATKDITVTWTSAEPSDGFVLISGTSLVFSSDPNGYGLGGFSCVEKADKGKFTVPGWMVWTDRTAAGEALDLTIQHYQRQEVSAPGLDYGHFIRAFKLETLRATITK